MQRDFRSVESYAAENATRKLIKPFLERLGFSRVRDKRVYFGKTQSQLVHAIDQAGDSVAMRVRLCWREREDRVDPRTFSAAQLQARVQGSNWVASISAKIERELERGVTHLLLVQPFRNRLIEAAQIPIRAVVPIWERQRSVSDQLIRAGRRGARSSNHAMNGASPTLWLRDDKAPEVPAALWRYPGVRNLLTLQEEAFLTVATSSDDSVDDLATVDYRHLGSDSPARVARQLSGVRRDPRVRSAVLERSRGKCEDQNCGSSRPYSGFLDVHHILGAEKSDRVWNCIALCPNCHREAHFSPAEKRINARYLAFARQFAN